MSLPKKPEVVSFLNELFNTNKKFSKKYDKNFFKKFSQKQNPCLTILKCSDSRVQIESFIESPQNTVFTIRNIGNQVDTCEGSIDFGIRVIATPFLLILGHSGCGAIEYAINNMKTNTKTIDKELSNIHLKSTTASEAVIENVNYQVKKTMNKYNDLVEANKLTIFGAIYDFKNEFGFGYGKLFLTSVNNENDSYRMSIAYQKHVKNLKLFKSVPPLVSINSTA